MKLPADYLERVQGSTRILLSLATAVREQAAQTPESSELWLTVRDLEGLAGRLEANNDEEWRHGWISFITGQDIGVLDELLDADRDGRPVGRALLGEERQSLEHLGDFLVSYTTGGFEFEQPAP